jgi:gamma-glutamylcyclotransferase
MYYFAYGSNLSTRYMRQYCPSASFVIKADLANYRVEFRHYSQAMQGGISSIVEAPGELVQGVIYEVASDEIVAMDAQESVAEGIYRRQAFLVLGEDGNCYRADLYRVGIPAGPYAPAAQYLDLMIEGAQEHGLRADYIERLLSLRRSLD